MREKSELTMPDSPRILIVDDDPIVAESLAEFLRREGYGVATAGDGTEASNILDDHPTPRGEPMQPFGLVITDVNMPRTGGMDLLKSVRKKHPSAAVIVITGYGKIEAAVEAIKLGAVEYLTKPVVDDELRVAVSKAIQQHALLAENETLRSQLTERFGMDNLVGADYRMQKVYDLVEAVAESKTTVLVDGESGTGKTMVARAIHTRSQRRTGPFVTFSCGSIPETLLESELFGHVRGAHSPGPTRTSRAGAWRPTAGHYSLMRSIPRRRRCSSSCCGCCRRSSSSRWGRPRRSRWTCVSCWRRTRRWRGWSKVTFREDLFYRINVVNIHLPPLRERMGDVPLLVENFLAKYCKEMGKDRTISDEALAVLRQYHWPGNVRELENAIERAVVLSRRPRLEPDDLPDTVRGATGTSGSSGSWGSGVSGGGTARLAGVSGANGSAIYVPALTNGWTPTPLERALEEPEKQIILAALKANQWNRQETARQLDINRTTLYKKIKQYQLDEPG